MKTFKDVNGREWSIVVDVGTIRTVKDLTGVQLLKLHGEEGAKVFDDPCLFVDVLYAVCKEQANNQGVSDIQFGKAMVGDVLERGLDALMEEVANFFPSGRREILNKQMSKAKQIATELEKKAIQAIENLDATTLISSMKLQVDSVE